ncbi:zinc ABC transporter substrate-binding protein [Psychrobacter sp. YP14]|uniref:metal ABC transporter substrate-binding protein n=1 Tax=Psychrobacter sp. YP14 TaxID=2203895 RepID=UPI000D7D9C1C|nr:metal ABC transporter substrate-binding protein [Psychrobacter sp. YP14]AWT48237.1 zinc ABC transporter substrate-binding protein [Psychrobacter sp. YP14]
MFPAQPNTALHSLLSKQSLSVRLKQLARGVGALLLTSAALTTSANAAAPSTAAAPIGIDQLPAAIRDNTQIAISNYPLFLLSEAVTKGAPSGKLLLDPGDVGHHGSLSPSDMKTVQDSRYVIWFGSQLESNLAKPLAKTHNSISLFGLKAFHREPLRDVKAEPIEGTLDPHIWLDPNNAKAITRALGAIYSRANPEYKAIYAANVQRFAQQMDRAVQQAFVSSKSPRPYWAYHDAFHYIEPALNLRLAGALTSDHHLPPKASQFHWLKQNRPKPTMCMLLQADSNQGVLSKLKPINSTVQQEDMSGATDFISGWQALAKDINTCIG